MERTPSLELQVEQLQPLFQAIQRQLEKAIIGQQRLLNRLMIGLLTGGHLLLEGMPGLAKTLAITSLAKALGCSYKRIQFTPDLLPADLVGTTIYHPQEGSFTVNKGPIFTNILLADEINRAPAKVQSALLEVMQEKQVTLAGQSYPLQPPFLVLATQNPIEHEGTYLLPEAQTDRFLMKVLIDYPSFDQERQILERLLPKNVQTITSVATREQLLEAQAIVQEVYIDAKIVEYLLQIVFATRHPARWHLPLERLIESGGSPRASIAIYQTAKAHALLQGRCYVTPFDVKQVATEVLRHRIRCSYEAEAEGVRSDQIVQMILEKLPSP